MVELFHRLSIERDFTDGIIKPPIVLLLSFASIFRTLIDVAVVTAERGECLLAV